MDKKSIGKLLADVALKHPERYEEIAKIIADLGRKASFLQGETLTLSDTEPVIDREAVFNRMDHELDNAKRGMSKKEFEQERIRIWAKYSDSLEKDTVAAALGRGSNLAYNVVSGARGSPTQLKMMVSTPALYTDAQDNVVPVFVRHSFGDGLRPAEYLAGSYGARKAVLSTKRATAKGGDLSKQMTQVATPLVVTTRDCGKCGGIDLDIDDSSLRGRVLAEPMAGMTPGTVLDRQAINQLHKKGIKKVLAHSVLTCNADTGVCAKCVGLQPNGKFPDMGDAVGITAATAIGEPVTQGALNVKHQSGALSGAKKTYSGFDVISRFVQTPETFPDRAVVSESEGTVTSVKEAPQGGYYVQVGDDNHYVAPGYPILVHKGDKVEAGDALSEGLIDPGDVVRLRGLGEGRRYYADRLKQILDDSGLGADRRNTEMLARAALDHVQVQDAGPDDPFMPDDVISYSYMANKYTPPASTVKMETDKAIGKYIQVPVLHYTIGTKVTPSIAKRLQSVDKNNVYVSDTAPTFKPDMIRLRTASNPQRDWMAGLHTSYLKKNLSDSAARGEDTNISENVHFAPRLAIGVDFGKNVRQTGKF
jgi:DNA-directed RNA polymerase subunit beta'